MFQQGLPKRLSVLYHWKKRGVLLAFKSTLAFQLKAAITDPKGRYNIVMCEINAQAYRVVALYVSNSHQVRFTRKLLIRISTIRQGQLLMSGDFNLTVNLHLDSSATLKEEPTHFNLFHPEEIFDVWNAHKAFIRGILIQQGAQAKKEIHLQTQ